MSSMKRLSRSAAIALGAVVVLALIALSGFFSAESQTDLDKDEAVELATDQVDFEPGQVAVRLVRQGVGLDPVWAVSLSEPGTDNVVVVRVDAVTGEVIEVRATTR